MSTKNQFDAIWDEIIENSIRNFCERLGVKHKPFFLLKIQMKKRYNTYKNAFIKGNMYLNTKNIDRHKISSCIAKSILMTKPLYIPLVSKVKFVFSNKSIYEVTSSSKTYEKYFMFLNEYLTLDVVVSILESYITSDNRADRFKHKIVLPEPFPVDDPDYLVDICIGLHNCKARHFNTVAFANTLFLWEKYSCRKTRCDNLAEFCKDILMKQGMSEEQAKSKITQAEFAKFNKDTIES